MFVLKRLFITLLLNTKNNNHNLNLLRAFYTQPNLLNYTILFTDVISKLSRLY